MTDYILEVIGVAGLFGVAMFFIGYEVAMQRVANLLFVRKIELDLSDLTDDTKVDREPRPSARQKKRS